MRSAFALLFLVFAVQFASAQDEISDNPLFPKPRPKRVFIGPMVGYNSNFHSGGFRTLGGVGLSSPDCGDFGTGGGNGILVGLAGEYWFKPGGPTALQMRVYYEQKPGTFTAPSTPLPIVDTSGQVHYFTRTHEVTAAYDLINIEVQYKYNLPSLPRFGVAVGPKIGFVMKSSYKQVQKLDNGFYFADSTKPAARPTELVLVDNPNGIPGVGSTRFALVGHLQYELLAGSFLITPRVLYDLGITKVTGSWSVSSLAGTVEIKYGF